MRRIALVLCWLVGLTMVIPHGDMSAIAQEAITAKGRVYAGMYSDQWDSSADMDAMAAWAGQRVTFMGSFHHVWESDCAGCWSENTETILEEAWQAKATPFANIAIQGASASSIAAGHHDEAIRLWAGHVKEWLHRGGGRSLIVAPLQEMNGDWVPYGMDPANFKVAYNRFREIFRSVGMDETKVRWAFAPNGWSTPPYEIADYYPGDSVVDVIGISAYNFGSGIAQWSSVYETFAGALHELRSTVSPEKPYFIAQTASSSDGGDKDAWLREMFTYLANDQNVVAFVYFNIDKETDWKVWRQGWGSAGFREGMGYASTDYDWPLTDWFQPGPIPFQAFTPPFWDDDGSIHEPDIVAIYEAGITRGCNAAGDMYCPLHNVTRGQMAAFLERAEGLSGATRDYFWDDNGHLFESDINALAEDGTTKGCNVAGDMYCPDGFVTRGQMAAFVARARGLPPASRDYFSDDNGDQFEREINALAEAGITKGCNAAGDKFCPHDLINRAQMASFLARAFLP